jgi:hypothetical protein
LSERLLLLHLDIRWNLTVLCARIGLMGEPFIKKSNGLNG